MNEAFSNPLSVIEGPPGTGKTQTILNIIANAVMNNQSVAVVSSNNSATKNVFEKLEKNGLSFIAALLGSSQNKKDFIGSQTEIPDLSEWRLSNEQIKSLQKSTTLLFAQLAEKLELKNELANLKLNIEKIETEYQHFSFSNPTFADVRFNITDNSLETEPIENEFKINFELPKKEAMELLDTFNNNKTLDDISLDAASIKSFEQFTKGFRIKEENELKLVQFIKLPTFSDTIDIIFNDGEEFNSTTVEVFTAKPNDDEKHIKIILFDFTIIFKFKRNGNKNAILANISILPNQKISNVANALKFFNIYDKFMDGIDFKIFKGSEIIYESLDVSKMSISSDKEHPLTRYFKGLKMIEQHYGVRFSNIDIDYIDFTMLDCIIAYIQKRRLKIKSEPMSIKLKNKQEVEGFLEKINQKIVMISRPEEKIVLNFHDLEFNVGFYELIMNEAYISNYEDLKNGTSCEAIINSKSNSVYLQYVDNRIQIKTEPLNLSLQ